MQAFWNVAAMTGLVSDGSMPPSDCAWPLQKLENLAAADEMSERHFAQSMDMVNAKDWEVLSSFKDPEPDGDLHLWTKPQIGRYHFMKVTMSLKNITPEAVLDFALTEELSGRKEFSADITALDILGKTENCNLEHNQYGAPAPVAGRDFVLLTGRKELDNGVIVAYGCSVDSPKVPEGVNGLVRGACHFTWHVTPVGDHTMVTYINCIDPRGWTPSFLLAWLKGTATQEFLNIRSVLAGKKADLHKIDMKEVGVSEEDLKAAEAEKEKNTVK